MESKNKITIKTLAMENIRQRPLRSFVLIVFIMLFTFVLLLGSLISKSLSGGIESLSNRLGADVMVVPSGYETRIDAVLLTGIPSEFYLPESSMEHLKSIEGIKSMSPQTYIATLSASCCSAPLQIIGIDYQTDFIIKPWLEKNLDSELRDGQIIVGQNVNGEAGSLLKFYGKPFKVVGRLERTGMGFDNTVFMTRKTASELAREAERKKKHPVSEDASLISVVMIKLETGYDSVEVAREITKKLSNQGLYGMYSKKFVNSVSSNLSVVSAYIGSIIVGMWILASLVIALIFAMIFNERKKEMGVLRVLGASRKALRRLVLTEAFLISFFAAVLGSVLALLALAILMPMIGEALKIPFLLPKTSEIVVTVLSSLLLGALTGPLASLYTVRKVGKDEIYNSLREG